MVNYGKRKTTKGLQLNLSKGDRIETPLGLKGTVKWVDNGQAKVAWSLGEESYIVPNPHLKVTPAKPMPATTEVGFKVKILSYERAMAEVEFSDGSTDRLPLERLKIEPVEEPKKEEPIRAGDRVRHNGKVSSDFRRLGGRVMTVNVTGQSVVVRWDGIGSYREELVSQLEVVHRAEKVEPTPMEQVIQLLDTEGAVVSAEIDRLQERLRALNAAKAALPVWK